MDRRRRAMPNLPRQIAASACLLSFRLLWVTRLFPAQESGAAPDHRPPPPDSAEAVAPSRLRPPRRPRTSSTPVSEVAISRFETGLDMRFIRERQGTRV